MANRIVFHYNDMDSVVGKIKGYSESYKNAGNLLISEIDKAMAPWKGASKNNFQILIDGDVKTYVSVSVPNMVLGLSELLKNNSDTMSNADDEIAKNIPTKI